MCLRQRIQHCRIAVPFACLYGLDDAMCRQVFSTVRFWAWRTVFDLGEGLLD